MNPKIVVGNFLMETFFKNGPHNRITPEKLVSLATQYFPYYRPGYRDGVIQIPLPVLGGCQDEEILWSSNIVELKNGDCLFGKFKARAGGEDPRKSITVLAQPDQLMPVKGVDAILYHKSVLGEDLLPDEELEHDGDYEIVKVNIKVVDGEQPMPPETLLSNHYQVSGGTSTKMSAEEFEAALRESFNFWKNKAYSCRRWI